MNFNNFGNSPKANRITVILNKKDFCSNDLVSGYVEIEAAEEIKYSQVVLNFHGIEEFRGKNRKIIKNTAYELKLPRENINEESPFNEKCSNNHIPNLLRNLFSKNKGNILKKGQVYVFIIKFKLPELLPPTCSFEENRLHYFVKCDVRDVFGIVKIRSLETELIIKGSTFQEKFVREFSKEKKKLKVLNPLFSFGKIKSSIRINSQINTNNEFNGTWNIQNSSNRQISGLRVDLVRKIYVKGSKKEILLQTKKYNDKIDSTLPWKSKNGKYNWCFKLNKNPLETIDSFVSPRKFVKWIKIKYFIEFRAKVKMGKDIYIKLPVYVKIENTEKKRSFSILQKSIKKENISRKIENNIKNEDFIVEANPYHEENFMEEESNNIQYNSSTSGESIWKDFTNVKGNINYFHEEMVYEPLSIEINLSDDLDVTLPEM